MEGEIISMQEIFRFEQRGVDVDGKVLGHFSATGVRPRDGAPVPHGVYEQLLRSYDEGVAEFLDLERVKPNTLGNTRMLLHL